MVMMIPNVPLVDDLYHINDQHQHQLPLDNGSSITETEITPTPISPHSIHHSMESPQSPLTKNENDHHHQQHPQHKSEKSSSFLSPSTSPSSSSSSSSSSSAPEQEKEKEKSNEQQSHDNTDSKGNGEKKSGNQNQHHLPIITPQPISRSFSLDSLGMPPPGVMLTEYDDPSRMYSHLPSFSHSESIDNFKTPILNSNHDADDDDDDDDDNGRNNSFAAERLSHRISPVGVIVEDENPHARFELMLEEELLKINTFYSKMEDRFSKRHLALMERVKQMNLHKNSGPIPKKHLKMIKNAFKEHYRSLILLRNYRILNNTGFVKIIKKYDKVAGQKLGLVYGPRIQQQEYFMTSRKVDQLMTEVETVFSEEFAGSDRKRAMEMLRVPAKGDFSRKSHQASQRSTFISGTMLGASAILSGLTAYNYIFHYPRDSSLITATNASAGFFMYRVLLFPISLALLLCVNVFAWSRFGINYRFIFELDPRQSRSSWIFLQFASTALAVWCFSLFVFMQFLINELNGIPVLFPSIVHPIALYVVMFVWMALPLNILFGPQRLWMWSSLYSIAMAPFRPVLFRDFFIADQLTSMGDFLFNIQYAVCRIDTSAPFFSNILRACGYLQNLGIPILNAFPYWSRFLQCLRRYYDTRKVHPNLTNALKYVSGLAVVVMAFIDGVFTAFGWPFSTALRVSWFIVAVISTLYRHWWDMYMDFGLGRKGHGFLRAELMYPHKILYYAAIFLNIWLRFVWAFAFFARQIVPDIMRQEWMLFLISFLELFRRFIWNFLRLENEHLHNCEDYRAVKEIPLPILMDGKMKEDKRRATSNSIMWGNSKMCLCCDMRVLRRRRKSNSRDASTDANRHQQPTEEVRMQSFSETSPFASADILPRPQREAFEEPSKNHQSNR